MTILKSSKRRFGISIPENLARDLDKLASKLSIDRSSLVSEAIRTYVHDHLHYLTPHKCMGILILFSNVENDNYRKLLKIIEEYRDIIISYTHHHIEEKCIEVLILSGSSEKIRSLHREFTVLGYKARYLPLVHNECH